MQMINAMSKEELILDKLNMMIEKISEHFTLCPNCHLKSVLKSIMGDNLDS